MVVFVNVRIVWKIIRYVTKSKNNPDKLSAMIPRGKLISNLIKLIAMRTAEIR